VHTSLLANGLWANTCYVQGALVEAEFPDRSVVRPITTPARLLYETSDGRLLQLYMVRTAAELDALLIAMGRADLLADERFADHETRVANMAEVVEILQEEFRQRTAAEWLSLFRSQGVPVTPVVPMPDVLHDAQLAPNNMAVPPTDERVPAKLVLNHPLNIDGLPRVGPRHAPAVGENTAEVLAELGLTDEAIEDYRKRGIV